MIVNGFRLSSDCASFAVDLCDPLVFGQLVSDRAVVQVSASLGVDERGE